jgi:hypothetical protein
VLKVGHREPVSQPLGRIMAGDGSGYGDGSGSGDGSGYGSGYNLRSRWHGAQGDLATDCVPMKHQRSRFSKERFS